MAGTGGRGGGEGSNGAPTGLQRGASVVITGAMLKVQLQLAQTPGLVSIPPPPQVKYPPQPLALLLRPAPRPLLFSNENFCCVVSSFR